MMEPTDQNIVNDSQAAASSLSRVNPNSTIKKLKDKGTLALVAIVLLVMLIFMFSGQGKEQEKSKVSSTPSIENRDVLTKNLLLIEKMKQEAKNKDTAVSRQFADGTPFLGVSPSKPISEPQKTEAFARPVNHEPQVTKEILARMNAPTTFVNVSSRTINTGSAEGHTNQPTMAGSGDNSQFINQQSSITSVSASRIPHPNLTVPAGELIPATMNVAMNSELPGMISAVTERNVYSLTGSNVLIPRGSKLMGQYNSGIVQGQNRFLVVWNRVQLANGVIVTLNSSGTDSLGRAGINADSVDRHFIERFGTATLLSVLGAATANAGVDSQTQFNSAAQYRSAVADSLNQTAAQTLEQDMKIKPTLDKYQGVEVNVFVAHDLDFSSVGSQEVRHVSRVMREVWK